MSKDVKESEKEDGSGKKKRPNMEKLLTIDLSVLTDILNLIKTVGASGIYLSTFENVLSFGLNRKRINVMKLDYETLKELSVKKIGDLIAPIIFTLHSLEEHEFTVERILEKVEVEDKVQKFEKVFDIIKSHEAFPELKFIMEKFGNKLLQIKGREITAKTENIKIQSFEIILSYIDLNSKEKSIRLVLSRPQMSYLISDLQKLMEE